jgi:hypothetical protein
MRQSVSFSVANATHCSGVARRTCGAAHFELECARRGSSRRRSKFASTTSRPPTSHDVTHALPSNAQSTPLLAVGSTRLSLRSV